MAAATAREIQDAVRTFLGGGSVRGIYYLTGQHDNDKALVESTGVVDKLVDHVANKTAYEESGLALRALSFLVLLGPVAQDAIAHAHNGAIFAWLAGPEDHGRAAEKNTLMTNLHNNHSGNTILLEIARDGAASLAEKVLTSLQSGDTASAALTMKVLVDVTQRKGATSTIPDSSIATWARIFNWDPTNTDVQLRVIRNQAELLLLQHLRSDQVSLTPTPSALSISDLLDVLTEDSSDIRAKLLAVLRLNQLAKENTYSARDIVSRGGITAVAAVVRVDTESVQEDKLPQEAALLLTRLARESASMSDQVVQGGSIASLEILCCSGKELHKVTGFGALRHFLSDVGSAASIARECGIPFLLQLLKYHWRQRPTQQDIPIVEILVRVFKELTRETNFRQAAESDDAIAFLVDFLSGASSADRDGIPKVAEILGGFIPFLLFRLSVELRPSNDVRILRALEHLSRVPANQPMFRQREGLKSLSLLLKTSTNPDEVSTVARILANISCKNPEMSRLIVQHGAAERLITVIKSSDTKIQTAGLMALRNLVSNDVDRGRIGSLGVVLPLTEMVAKGKCLKQRVTAAAVLGGLARLPTNKQRILYHRGDGALLRLLCEAQTPSQVETAAAALWVLTENSDVVIQPGKEAAQKVIMKAIERHNQDEVPWATHLLQRLK